MPYVAANFAYSVSVGRNLLFLLRIFVLSFFNLVATDHVNSLLKKIFHYN